MKLNVADNSRAEALFVQGEQAEEKEGYEDAAKLLTKAANLGHTGAEVNLGNFYSWGRGVQRSASKAAYWYRRAYKHGDECGALNLAVDRLAEGNTRSAILWFKRAADMRSGEAILQLAKFYSDKPRRKAKAIELLRAAQKMGPSEISEQAKEDAISLLVSMESAQ